MFSVPRRCDSLTSIFKDTNFILGSDQYIAVAYLYLVACSRIEIISYQVFSSLELPVPSNYTRTMKTLTT